MKIEAVTAKFPSKTVSNECILNDIKHFSESEFKGDIDKLISRIKKYLIYSGSNKRVWRNIDEKPIDLLKVSFEDALSQADLQKEDIDLLIYVGIGRGFAEPGGAYHVANALGINEVECFDIIDACMSWIRGLQIANTFFKSGEYKRICIVNAEFNLGYDGAIYPDVFKFKNEEKLEWSFPAFTIGEAATTTILSSEEVTDLDYRFISRPKYVDLCNIPIHEYEVFSSNSEKIGKNGVGRFTSYGFELHKVGNPEIINCLQELRVSSDEIDIVFTHASSKREWQKLANSVGLGEKIYHIYQDTGNLVSASIPAAMSKAVADGSLKRGDRVLLWVGSAGMSFCALKLIF